MTYPLSPAIVHTGHLARRDDRPLVSPRDAVRTVEVNGADLGVPRAGRLKPTAAMASTATEATARRHDSEHPQMSFNDKVNLEIIL